MITEIKISNFKAIGEQISIPIRPITLLFGANSSGKSSIIQCLMMLAQSIGKDITPKGQHVDTGSFQNFIFKNDKERIFEIQFTIDIHENLFIEILRDHPKRDEYDWQELLNETTRSLINSLSDFTTASVCFRFKYDSNQAVNLFEIDFFLDQHQHEKPCLSGKPV